MPRSHRLALAVGIALLALAPTTVLAASASESISGVELGIPTACGPSGSTDSMSTFGGGASGTINGVWSASVCHTELSIAPGPTATISGGVFRVSGFRGWHYVAIVGSFVSGSIPAGVENDYLVKGVGTCTQVFAVSIKGTGPSNFVTTLKHYGLFFSGSCHVVSATLNGAGQITY
jgi:hypothetical protein